MKKLMVVLGLSAVMTAVGVFGVSNSVQPQQSALMFTPNHHDMITTQ